MSVSSPMSLMKRLKIMQCAIFEMAYNPSSKRTGSKYLKARLRGPEMVKYYPRVDDLSVGQLNKKYPGFNLVDTEEVMRLNKIEEKKKRGKGTPKKAKSKSESRRTHRHGKR